MPVMRVVDAFDRKLAATLPGIFALQVQLVFEKLDSDGGRAPRSAS